MNLDIEELAKCQLTDYDRHQPGSLFRGYPIPMTIEDAYALQFAVARLRVQRGERVAGYKVGCISAVMQSQLGLDRPVFGHVFETEIKPSGTALNADNFDHLAIEGEFAVRIAADVENENWLVSHRTTAAVSAFAVIELHNYVFRNVPHNAQELIGNNAIHAGVVLPAWEPPLTDVATLLESFIRVSKNGAALGIATGRALSEGPFGSIVRLVRHLTAFGQILRRGQIVLTGSPLPLYPVAKGDRIEVRSDRSSPVIASIQEG